MVGTQKRAKEQDDVIHAGVVSMRSTYMFNHVKKHYTVGLACSP